MVIFELLVQGVNFHTGSIILWFTAYVKSKVGFIKKQSKFTVNISIESRNPRALLVSWKYYCYTESVNYSIEILLSLPLFCFLLFYIYLYIYIIFIIIWILLYLPLSVLDFINIQSNEFHYNSSTHVYNVLSPYSPSFHSLSFPSSPLSRFVLFSFQIITLLLSFFLI